MMQLPREYDISEANVSHYIDLKQWSALLHAFNWCTNMHFAAVHSFHAGQHLGRKRGDIGKGKGEGRGVRWGWVGVRKGGGRGGT